LVARYRILFPSMHFRNYIEPPLTSFNTTRVSFHYLNGKYRLRNRVAPRLRNAGVYLSAQGRGISASTPSCETRHRMHPGRVANMSDLYAIFSPLLFFFLSFFFASYRKLHRKTERGGRKIHYVLPDRLSRGYRKTTFSERTFIKCGAWVCALLAKQSIV